MIDPLQASCESARCRARRNGGRTHDIGAATRNGDEIDRLRRERDLQVAEDDVALAVDPEAAVGQASVRPAQEPAHVASQRTRAEYGEKVNAGPTTCWTRP